MKKDKTEENKKLENDSRNNEEVQNLIQQISEMKEQIPELEDRHLRSSLWFMGIKEKSCVESEKWQESETKVKVFLEEKLGFQTDEITIDRTHRIGKKKREKKGPS